jgi:SAM-dependent methyltransferase
VTANDHGPASTLEAQLASRVERYAAFDRANGPYLAWQLEQFAPYLGRRIVEVGVGIGGILERLGRREAILGIDVEPEVLDATRARFVDRPDISLELGDLADPALATRLAAFRPDTIVCINVLEHVRDDLAVLQRLESALAPGGHLCLLVPAHFTLYGPYDRTDGHYRRYSKSHLRVLLSHTGLRVTRLRYFNAPGALGWFVQYRLLGRKIHGEGELGLMNRLIPFLRRFEAAIPPPFGLSVVAVCERRI